MVTGCYRLPGTPNFPDAKKQARGRISVPTQLLRVTDKVWSVDDLNAAFPSIANQKLKAAKAQPAEKPVGALNGGGPIRSTPPKSTVVKLKVARKASPEMDRSAQFQSTSTAVRAGMAPDDLETLMRQDPDGCAG